MSLRLPVRLLPGVEDQQLKQLLKPATSRTPPSFSLPKPTLIDGLDMLRTVSASLFQSSEFQAAIQQTFVKVGLAEGSRAPSAATRAALCGSITLGYLAPEDNVPDDEFTLRSVAVEMELEPRRLGDAFEEAMEVVGDDPSPPSK